MSITTNTCHFVVGIVVKPVVTIDGHTWQNIEVTMSGGARHTMSLHLLNEFIPGIDHLEVSHNES